MDGECGGFGGAIDDGVEGIITDIGVSGGYGEVEEPSLELKALLDICLEPV